LSSRNGLFFTNNGALANAENPTKINNPPKNNIEPISAATINQDAPTVPAIIITKKSIQCPVIINNPAIVTIQDKRLKSVLINNKTGNKKLRANIPKNKILYSSILKI